tara:strand:+ start:1622 stop:2299 length:678 start_codon:yes stop_codon:yes gene_type:complete
MSFTVVSSFTKNTRFDYSIYADRLKESMKRFNLDTSHVQEIQGGDTWKFNVSQKPRFIRKKLYEINEPIVWVDADAQFMSYPSLFDTFEKISFAARFYPKQLTRTIVGSGVVYFAPTQQAFQLLDDWVLWNDTRYTNFIKNSGRYRGDQTYLDKVLKKCMSIKRNCPCCNKVFKYYFGGWISRGLNYIELPESYSLIYSKKYKKRKDMSSVIMHFQASRKYKNQR